MTRCRIAMALSLIGFPFVVRVLEAQCSPNVQHLINERKFDAARAPLDAQLKSSAKDDAAMNCMGRLLLDKGEPGDAVDWLEKAVAIKSTSAQHHLWLGLALRAKAQQANIVSQAVLGPRMKAELERALAIDPTLVDARAALLGVYVIAPEIMGGSMPKAREQAAEMMKVNPMRGQMGFATVSEQEQDYPAAEQAFLAAIVARPDSEVSYSAAGGFYRRRERWTDAIAMYEKQLKFMPQDAPVARVSNAHYYLGVANQRGGHADRAKAEFQAAIAWNADNDNAKKALAALH